MKKRRLTYYSGLKSAMISKIIVALVFFAVFFNIVNLGAFYKGSLSEINTAAMHSEIGLSKIFNSINKPMKVVGDLFKSGDVKKEKSSDNDVVAKQKYAVITKPILRNSSELIKKDLFFSVKEIKSLYAAVYFSDTGPGGSSLNFLYSNNSIMILMLILLLVSVLPRGISVIRDNKNKYILHVPSLCK